MLDIIGRPERAPPKPLTIFPKVQAILFSHVLKNNHASQFEVLRAGVGFLVSSQPPSQQQAHACGIWTNVNAALLAGCPTCFAAPSISWLRREDNSADFEGGCVCSLAHPQYNFSRPRAKGIDASGFGLRLGTSFA